MRLDEYDLELISEAVDNYDDRMIMVDNDDVYLLDTSDNTRRGTFTMFGEELIVALFKELGCASERE